MLKRARPIDCMLSNERRLYSRKVDVLLVEGVHDGKHKILLWSEEPIGGKIRVGRYLSLQLVNTLSKILFLRVGSLTICDRLLLYYFCRSLLCFRLVIVRYLVVVICFFINFRIYIFYWVKIYAFEITISFEKILVMNSSCCQILNQEKSLLSTPLTDRVLRQISHRAFCVLPKALRSCRSHRR